MKPPSLLLSRLVNQLKYYFEMLAKKQARHSLPKVITIVRTQSLTYLSQRALYDLHKQVSRLEKEKVPGIFIEAGCALGGSAIVIGAAKSPSRKFYVYDVFDEIPPPSDKDGVDVHQRYSEIANGKSQGIDGKEYYGYIDNLIDRVAQTFDDLGLPAKDNEIYLVKGLFQDTIKLEQKVAFAHIDGDWYESVKVCLERIEPCLVADGVIVIDDYSSWSGCRKAVDEYFRDKQHLYSFSYHSRLQIKKL